MGAIPEVIEDQHAKRSPVSDHPAPASVEADAGASFGIYLQRCLVRA